MDGTCDQGGCKDVYSVATSGNYMSLYELDKYACDQLVQSVYVGYDPPTSLYVNANCDIYGCWPTTGQWLSVDYWEDPSDYQIVDVDMAIKITGAAYIDTIDCEYLRFSDPQYQCY